MMLPALFWQVVKSSAVSTVSTGYYGHTCACLIAAKDEEDSLGKASNTTNGSNGTDRESSAGPQSLVCWGDGNALQAQSLNCHAVWD